MGNSQKVIGKLLVTVTGFRTPSFLNPESCFKRLPTSGSLNGGFDPREIGATTGFLTSGF